MARSFLKCTDFSPLEAAEALELAKAFKQNRGAIPDTSLAGQTWALIFQKSSTRTRVSFEVGIHEMGGHPMYLDQARTQLGRGETVADTAKVLSRYVHGIVIRTFGHEIVEELASAGTVPVVNGLTDFLHPCQIYTDIFTAAERWAVPGQALADAVKGRKIAFLGDCASNMANSWILGCAHFGMEIALAGPSAYAPQTGIDGLLEDAGYAKNYTFTTDPFEAVKDADVVYTDVWVSMGDEAEKDQRLREMQPYQVSAEVFAAAKPDAFFMHCLPAHVGEEVTQEVLDNPRSIVFDEAENRLHMQKAILALLVRHDPSR
jgi:ornithine carbamoyltransferase